MRSDSKKKFVPNINLFNSIRVYRGYSRLNEKDKDNQRIFHKYRIFSEPLNIWTPKLYIQDEIGWWRRKKPFNYMSCENSRVQ